MLMGKTVILEKVWSSSRRHVGGGQWADRIHYLPELSKSKRKELIHLTKTKPDKFEFAKDARDWVDYSDD